VTEFSMLVNPRTARSRKTIGLGILYFYFLYLLVNLNTFVKENTRLLFLPTQEQSGYAKFFRGDNQDSQVSERISRLRVIKNNIIFLAPTNRVF
jgi:hypothetical protein